MSDALATPPTPGHELLLGLAGWVDDDLLAIARELVAVGEETGALELLVASLSADRTVLPHPVRSRLADAAERRIGGDLARLLPPGAPLPDRTAHVFTADVGDPDATERIREVVAGLTAVSRGGTRTVVTWRLTPAGAAPGPVPHPVVLLVLDGPAPAEVIAYQVGAALARAGIPASVEAFVDGAPLPPYQRAALAAAGVPVRPPDQDPRRPAPTSVTVTGPHAPVPDDETSRTDPSWSGSPASSSSSSDDRSDGFGSVADPTVPVFGTGSGTPGGSSVADVPPVGRAGAGTAPGATAPPVGTSWVAPTPDRAWDAPSGDRTSDDGTARASFVEVDGFGTSVGTGRAPSVDDTGSGAPAGGTRRVPSVEDTVSAAPAGEARRAWSVDDTGSASPVGGTRRAPSPGDTGSGTPVDGNGHAPFGETTGSGTPADGGRRAPSVDDTGAGGPGGGTEAVSPPHTVDPSPTSDAPPASPTRPDDPAGVDPARFDPARNAVDRTVHGGSRVPQHPDLATVAPPDGDGAGGASYVEVRPDPDPPAATNGHPPPRPAPRPVPRPASTDTDPPVNGHASDRPADDEQEWERQWGTGAWSTPSRPDPDLEPATSPTPTTPPLSRVPPSPTRRSSGDEEPEGARSRHRLDAAEPAVAREDVLDSRLTPNEQELLRRLQQELAAREGGSGEPPRNGTSYEQD